MGGNRDTAHPQNRLNHHALARAQVKWSMIDRFDQP
jgi:hypothetical protein